MHIRAGLAVVALGLVGALGLITIPGGGAEPPLVETAVAKVAPVIPGDVPDVIGAMATVNEAIVAYLVEQERLAIEAAVAIEAEEQERQRQAAAAAAAAAAARPRPAPAPSAPAAAASGPVITGDVWWSLALCESGGNPGTNTGNGYYGAFQFTLSTWRGVGGSGYPHEHSYETQRSFAQTLQARAGWGQWPACARRLGLL